jgi:hypothetical protein
VSEAAPTDPVDAVEALHARVARGEEVADGASDAGTVQVVRRDGAVDHVRVDLPRPLALERLSARFGPVTWPPRNPSGRRSVVFAATAPAEDEDGCTVSAEVDQDGRAVAVVLRRDEAARS